MVQVQRNFSETVDFQGLLDQLPKHSAKLVLATRSAYIRRCEPPQFYLEPTFQVRTEAGPNVMLVTAPGAVGKTALAIALAARTGAIYIDLSQIQVGSRTFDGLMLSAFGADGIGKALGALLAGEAVVILDGLDEAQARAGGENFRSFIDDIATSTFATAKGISLILAGRPDTILLVQDVLSSNVSSFRVATAELQYFVPDSTSAFVAGYLDAMRGNSPDAPHRRHGAAFERALDSVLSFVSTAIARAGWTDQVARSFIGYAPVLEGIAVFLDGANYFDLETRFNNADESGPAALARNASPWQLIKRIVVAILDREQEKFTKLLRARFGQVSTTGFAIEWRSIYSRDEQLRLILDTLLPDRARAAGQAPVPETMIESYLEALNWFLPQHPFFRPSTREFANVLFSEFTKAYAVARSALTNDKRERPYSALLEATTYLSSPVFGHLAILLQSDEAPPDTWDAFWSVAPDSRPSIPPEMVGPWAESLSESRSLRSHGARFDITPVGRDGECVGELADTVLGVRYLVAIAGQADFLDLGSNLKRCSVKTYGGVTLGDGGDLRLGPEVSIECGFLTVSCTRIVVKGEVTVKADLFDAGGPLPKVRVSDRSVLQLEWPHMTYPWVQFRPEHFKDQRTISTLIANACASLLGRFKYAEYFTESSGVAWRNRMGAGPVLPFWKTAGLSRYENMVLNAWLALEVVEVVGAYVVAKRVDDPNMVADFAVSEMFLSTRARPHPMSRVWGKARAHPDWVLDYLTDKTRTYLQNLNGEILE